MHEMKTVHMTPECGAVVPYFSTQVKTFGRLLHTKDDVHAIRVTIRRLRAAIKFLEVDEKEISVRRCKKILKKVARTAGQQRELEVAIKDAKRFGLANTNLRAKLRNAKCRTHSLLKQKSVQKAALDLRWIAKHGVVKEQKMTREISKLAHHLERWDHHLPQNGRDEHRFRIEMKRVRYTLELLGHPTDPIKKIQASLGRGHDLLVLRKLNGSNSKVRQQQRRYSARAHRQIPRALQFASSELNQVETKK